MTLDEGQAFKPGREVYCTSDNTLWTITSVDHHFDIIYMSNPSSLDLREIPYSDFKKNYYFTDEQWLWGTVGPSAYVKCECGLEKYGQGGKHSDFCPKYEREK